jgi:hypothetical protein
MTAVIWQHVIYPSRYAYTQFLSEGAENGLTAGPGPDNITILPFF